MTFISVLRERLDKLSPRKLLAAFVWMHSVWIHVCMGCFVAVHVWGTCASVSV